MIYFLSPMADGPVTFSPILVDSNNEHIQQTVSRFGRKF